MNAALRRHKNGIRRIAQAHIACMAVPFRAGRKVVDPATRDARNAFFGLCLEDPPQTGHARVNESVGRASYMT
jgi:hypothetical protein